MQVQILNRVFTTPSYPSGSNTWLLANAGELVSEQFTLIIDFNFTSNANQQVQFVSPYEFRLIGGDWGDLGFVIGGTYTITGEINQGGYRNYNGFSFTIVDIQGDLLIVDTELYPSTLDFTGNISPNSAAGNDPLLFTSSAVAPETIELFHNIVPNQNGFSANSLIDGEVNRFKIEGVDALSVSAFGTVQQLGNKSGGSYISQTFQRIADVGGKRAYVIGLTYFAPIQIEDADFEKPSYLDANQSVKPVIRIKAYPEDNNPNSVLTFDNSSQFGNVGWYNENYNQGINDFDIDSVVITNSSGDILSEVDHNDTCTITATITGASNFRDFTEVNFYVIPPTTEWKNNADSLVNNLRTSYFYKDDTAVTNLELTFPKSGQEVTTANQTIDVSTANTIVVSFDLIPNAAFTTYINSLASQDRRYRISLYAESTGGTDNENNGVSLIIQEGLLTSAPVPDQPYDKVTSALFYNHAQNIDSGVGAVNYQGCTEDDFVFKSLFNLTKSVLWERLSLSIEVVRDSDGAFFQLLNKVINFSNYITSPDGTININYSEQINQYLDSTGRNVLTVANTGVEVGSDYEVKIVWSLVASWRYWIEQNNALSDFFDGAIPNNGRNNEWMRYLREAGYSIRLRSRLLKDSVNYYWGGNIEMQDYEANLVSPTINTTIQYFDADGVEQSALLPGQDMKVRAEHTLLSGTWNVSDVWGWIAERGFETDPSKRITTAWDWTSQTSPLKPLVGETRAKLTFPSASVARVECLVDTSQVGDVTNTFVARIESPAAPECTSPLAYFFQLVRDASGDQPKRVNFLKAELERGITLPSATLCPPECEDNKAQFIYAFGNRTDVNTMASSFDPSPCCRNYYPETEVLLSCTAGYATAVDTYLDTITGDKTFYQTNFVDEINRYGLVNSDALFAEINATFTTAATRDAVLEHIVTVGFKIVGDGTNTIISEI